MWPPSWQPIQYPYFVFSLFFGQTKSNFIFGIYAEDPWNHHPTHEKWWWPSTMTHQWWWMSSTTTHERQWGPSTTTHQQWQELCTTTHKKWQNIHIVERKGYDLLRAAVTFTVGTNHFPNQHSMRDYRGAHNRTLIHIFGKQLVTSVTF